jgi:lipoprotein-anchoring transpeptidase ErfK/SrfK
MVQVFHIRQKRTSGILYFAISIAVFSLLIFGVILGFKAYAKTYKVEIKMAGSGTLAPEDPAVIEFSESVNPDSLESSISISPAIKVNYHWENGNKKLSIQPDGFWKLNGRYQISLQNIRSAMYTTGSANFQFDVTGYPAVSNFSPELGAKDVMVDIEDPIVINFTKSLEDFRVKVTTYPFQEMAYQMDEGKKEIQLLPQGEFARGTLYNFEIFLKYKKEDQYQKVYESNFTTKEPVPEEWSKDLSIRVEQAKKFTEPKITEGKYIDINLTIQVMTIFENGKLLDAYIISSGKRGMETPTGTFHIANKTPRAWSKKYGLYMPYWMALVSSGDFGIHELPEWPGGFKEGANHLGIPVSHGCVRLGIGPAERVYNWTELQTPVVVHY